MSEDVRECQRKSWDVEECWSMSVDAGVYRRMLENV